MWCARRHAYPFTILVFVLGVCAVEVDSVEGAHRDGEGKLEDVEDGEGEIARRHPE